MLGKRRISGSGGRNEKLLLFLPSYMLNLTRYGQSRQDYVQNNKTRWFLLLTSPYSMYLHCTRCLAIFRTIFANKKRTMCWSPFSAYDPFVPGSDKRTISCYLSTHKHSKKKIRALLSITTSWTVNAGQSLRWLWNIYHESLRSMKRKGLGWLLTQSRVVPCAKASTPLRIKIPSTSFSFFFSVKVMWYSISPFFSFFSFWYKPEWAEKKLKFDKKKGL